MFHMDDLRIVPDNLDVIGAALVDLIDQRLGDIYKGDLIARANKQLPDKTAADIASSEMDCLLHRILLSVFSLPS